MQIKHHKKYYVGGSISLIFLPILFFISTTEVRKKAIHYGSIEIQLSEDYGSYPDLMLSSSESPYVFLGDDETTKLSNFQQFCQSDFRESKNILRINLPDNSSYNFFIQLIDILKRNKFEFSLGHNTIWGKYRPELNYQQVYEPASIVEEFYYIYSELSTKVSTIKKYLSDEPIQRIRITKYADLGPPPSLIGSHYTPEIIKEEPRSSFYFRTIGLWFVPIIMLWIFLFILSIRRNNKLLPNQALKLTE
jgi:hypothetical protein